MLRGSDMVQMRAGDAIEDHVQSDESGQVGEILQANDAAIIESQHLQISKSFQLLFDFCCKISSESYRHDVQYIHQMRRSA